MGDAVGVGGVVGADVGVAAAVALGVDVGVGVAAVVAAGVGVAVAAGVAACWRARRRAEVGVHTNPTERLRGPA